jgi:hypothetical protein
MTGCRPRSASGVAVVAIPKQVALVALVLPVGPHLVGLTSVPGQVAVDPSRED